MGGDGGRDGDRLVRLGGGGGDRLVRLGGEMETDWHS